jgi:hypothetical protein
MIVGLTVAAATVCTRPRPPDTPPRLPPAPRPAPASSDSKATLRALLLPPPAAESSAKIGSPIVSHISVTSGRASNSGASRVRLSMAERGVGNRRGASI